LINTSPNITIVSPWDGYLADEGESINFEADAFDEEDGNLSGNSISWSSDRDGNLGTGRKLRINDLSAGKHDIYAIATDSEGEEASASIKINILGSGNNRPNAYFEVTPSSGTTNTLFQFDASGCSDEETPLSQLQVRWDWENDGTWDTGYSTDKKFLTNTPNLDLIV